MAGLLDRIHNLDDKAREKAGSLLSRIRKFDQLGTLPVLREVPGSTVKVGREYFTRPLASLGLGAADILTGGRGKDLRLQPKREFGRVGEVLFGKEEIRPVTARVGGYLEKKGLSKEKSRMAGLVFGLPLGILESDPRMSLRKSIPKGTLDMLKLLKTSEDVAPVISKTFGIADDIVKKYAPKIAELTDTKKIVDTLQQAFRESENIRKMPSKIITGLKTVIGKLTDGGVKRIYQETKDVFYNIPVKINNFTSVEDARNFLRNSIGKRFQSKALGADFSIEKITEEHFFDKTRPVGDTMRRATLLNSGIDIAQNSSILGAIDNVTDKNKGVVYYNILGTDTKNFPNTIIKVTISEENKNGKIFLSVADIEALKQPTISGRSPLPSKEVPPSLKGSSGAKISDFQEQKVSQEPFTSISDTTKIVNEGVDNVDFSTLIRRTKVRKELGDKTTLSLLDRARKLLRPSGQVLQKFLGDTSSAPYSTASKIKQEVAKGKPANLDINLEHFNVDDAAKKVLQDTINDIKPTLEVKVGNVLTNKEVKELADNGARVLHQAVDFEKTKQWEASLLNVRRKIAEASQNGRVDKDYIENLKILKTQGADIARKLQSFSIAADPTLITSKEAILDAVLRVSDNTDEILKAAEGVDFNDLNQATDFYRKFVAPTTQEWIDLLRYNSMLSSPNTHIVNSFSNFVNTLFVRPVTKAIAGSFDFISSASTGKEREMFAGEIAPYMAAYFSNMRKASYNFMGALSGKRAMTNLDVKHIPVATKGLKGKLAKTLSYPMRLLEASDQFFSALTESAEKAALQYRQAKGVKVPVIDATAKQLAEYTTFRQELFSENQGMVLDALDTMTSKLFELRNAKNPIISTIARFTVPFVRTPMNIFKQGIEYSPLGFITLKGAKNKTEQIAKAVIGSAVFAGAATMLISGRITWGEPINEREKNLWRAAGKQPYSIKIGDRWYSYQKLPPPLAFPLAMVAALEDTRKNKKIDDTTTELILTAIAKYGQFLSDQSYAKSIGDLLTAAKGGEAGIERLISNYPQQLIPYRALTGWLARLTDEHQRKPDPEGTFIDKQIQLLMMNWPGLSKLTPARIDEAGKPIEAKDRLINAFSPIRTQEESGQLSSFLERYEEYAAATKRENQLSVKRKEEAERLNEELSKLPPEEANTGARELKQVDEKLYNKLKDIREEQKYNYSIEEKYIKGLGVENGLRADYIWDALIELKTAGEKNTYMAELRRKKIISDTVMKQLKKLKAISVSQKIPEAK